MKDISFEQALDEIQKIIDTLENGNVDLNDSISLYEKGVKLTKTCKSYLDKASVKIEKINSQDMEQKSEVIE